LEKWNLFSKPFLFQSFHKVLSPKIISLESFR
jgi:hypothetical protein